MKKIVCLALALLSLGLNVQAAGGKVLTLHGRDEPETLDPGLFTGIIEGNIIVNLFEGLLRYDAKSAEPLPAMAKNWTVSSDGKTYTFYLRDGLTWSDGTPITAKDFFYSWERVLRPATAATYAFQLYPVKNAEEYNQGKITDSKQLGLKVINDKTFQVTLVNPTPYFLKLAAHQTLAPVNEAAVKKYGATWSFPGKIVCNGPFVLKQWTPQKEILLVKNEKYWDAANVKLDAVRFLPVPEYETAVKMYEMGQLDNVFELPPLKVATFKSRPDYIGAPYLNSMYYWFNTKVKPFDDVRVRQALTLAIDRAVITDKVLRRGDLPINSFVPPGITGYTPPAAASLFNPSKAKALLKEAGYGPGGKPFPAVDILYNTTAEHRAVAEVIQNMWKTHLGIEVKLRNEEWKSYLKSLDTRNYQIGRAGWVGDYVDPATFLDLLSSKNPMNYAGYHNPVYDKLLQDAAKEQNKTLRSRILAKAEALVLKDFPIIPLYVQVKTFLKKPYVKGYYPNMVDVHPLHWVSVEDHKGSVGYNQ